MNPFYIRKFSTVDAKEKNNGALNEISTGFVVHVWLKSLSSQKGDGIDRQIENKQIEDRQIETGAYLLL